jgi:hypothetical protein
MAEPVAEAYVRIRAQLDQLQRDLETQVGSAVKRAGDKAGRGLGARLGGGIKRGLTSTTGQVVGAVAGIAAVQKATDFIRSSINEATDAQKVHVGLQRAVNNTGQSYAKFGGQIDKTIQKQMNLAAIDDEDLARSFSTLVRGTGDVNKALRLNAVAADIARARNIDVGQAAQILTRINLGATGGLKRLGVEFTKTTPATDKLKGQIKALSDEMRNAPKAAKDSIRAQIDLAKSHLAAAKAADTQSNSQRAIDAVQKAFTGSAKDYAQTQAGQLDALAVKWGNFKEQVGTALIPIVSAIVSFGLRAVDALSSLGPYIDRGVALWTQYRPLVLQVAAAVQGALATALQTAAALAAQAQVKFEQWRPQIEAVASTIRSLLVAAVASARAEFDRWYPVVRNIAVAIGTNLVAAIRTVNGFVQTHQTLVKQVAVAVLAGLVAFKAITTGIALYQAAVRAAALAQAAFNVVMAANPLGIVVLAIAATVAALVLLYQRSETARKIMDGAWAGIKTGALDAMKVVQSAITTGRKVIDALGPAIAVVKAIVASQFAAIAAVVRTNIAIVTGIVRTVDALLHGEWGAAWENAKATATAAVRGAVNVIKALLGGLPAILLKLATAAGEKIASGLKAAATNLVGLAGDIGAKVSAALSQVATQAAGWAVGIGEAIVDGIIAGLKSLPGRAASKIGSGLSWARDHVGSTPEQVGERLFGKPLALGIIRGLDPLPKHLAGLMGSALRAAHASVQSIRGKTNDAMRELSSDIGRSLDQLDAKNKTRLARAQKDLADSLAKQRADVAASLASADADAAKSIARARADADPKSKVDATRIARMETDAATARAAALKTGNDRIAAAVKDGEDRIKTIRQDAQTAHEKALAAGNDRTEAMAKANAAKIAKATADALAGVRDRIQTKIDENRGTFTASFDRLAGDAMKAFDAQTTVGLQGITDKFDGLRKTAEDNFNKTKVKIEGKLTIDTTAARQALDAAVATAKRTLDDALSGIDLFQKALTPSEQALKDLQAVHDQAGRDAAALDAASALDAAKLTGDPVEIARAQKEVDDAAYNQRVFDLQTLATAERAARDQQAEAARAAAQATYDQAAAALQASADQAQAARDAQAQADIDAAQLAFDNRTTALNAQQAQEALNYQALRDLQARHLQDQLATLEAGLANGTVKWKQAHAQILKLFKDEFGPDYKVAGKNLGKAFADGLVESFGEVGGAAQRLAGLIAQYLRLRSPAEKGPLSDLHTWWRPLAPTLLGGVDQAMLQKQLSGMISPVGLTAGITASGGGAAGANGDRMREFQDAVVAIGQLAQRTSVGSVTLAGTDAAEVNRIINRNVRGGR